MIKYGSIKKTSHLSVGGFYLLFASIRILRLCKKKEKHNLFDVSALRWARAAVLLESLSVM